MIRQADEGLLQETIAGKHPRPHESVMFKLLTRKDLWVSVAFSLIVWRGLPLVGGSERFSMAFAALFLLLTVLTLALAEADNDSIEEPGATDEQDSDEEGETLYSVLSSQRETQRQIQEELSSLRKEVQTFKGISVAAPQEGSAAEVPAKLGELSGALSEAMKQISSRDTQIDLLTKNVNQSNIQRNLVRLAQSLEVARALQNRVSSGKSDPKESFDFVVDDLDSALKDQGVESMEVAVGTKVADLAAGSFAAISVVDAPEDALRGTIKEVRSRCYFISEEGKKPRFIAPAKVILYRA
jgi:molecular chaperone GrpE (heat shock protein)